jgi:small ligand-binding sensory domain FIST
MGASDTRTGLRFGAGLSTQGETSAAVAEVCSRALAQLDGQVDLAFAFVSSHHGPNFAPVAQGICDQIGTEALLGCTAESVVGGDREVEGRPALALWLAQLSHVTIRPMHLEYEETPEGGTIVGWPDDTPDEWPAGSALVALGDPFSFAVDAFLKRINEEHPGVPVLGGMASGGMEPGENRLLLGRRELTGGAVAALIHGAVRIRSVVSQGCRPIGDHFVVTRSNRNVIQELGGQPPLAQLKEILPKLSAADQMRIQQGLHVGRVINEYKDRFERGDFLVRNVIGADPGSGAIAIGELVRPGQTVQFHVRDAQSADEDLRQLLTAARSASESPPLGALLFTCNGRGTRLFLRPNHDAAVIREICGDIPTAGFFAQGELGPIGGKNFIHGFTASVVLFEGQDHG